ncbi:MAG: tRNA 2-thiouridine(34) synthase MnmA [Proteobacteria bacterium]|nr:tRNA 2-thiouridine(34) synthase MnmA [Pseudomonadota bacterium]
MKALVAMSGGVDSSVAAALMLEQGYDVVGVTLKQWEGPDGSMPVSGCCTLSDAEDARRVAAQLDIPYYVLDYVEDFAEAVIQPFLDGYLNGLTPNPCIECNRKVRFTALLERTHALGCDVLVTGHHARIEEHEGAWRLRMAIDDTKDQSYVLHMLDQQALSMVKLPVGEMTKRDVRTYASELGLRTASKPDSQDICFVTSGDYRDFLRQAIPDLAGSGEVLDTDGAVIGHHDGTPSFTIGQRRGLGVSVGEPRYVIDISPSEQTITVGTYDELLTESCETDELVFTNHPIHDGADVDVKLRYRSAPVPARAEKLDEGWRFVFREPEARPAPGQTLVVYNGEYVLGGGIIRR